VTILIRAGDGSRSACLDASFGTREFARDAAFGAVHPRRRKEKGRELWRALNENPLEGIG
jgi:hypothetical protein